MRTLENASFAEPLRLVALTALPMAFCLLVGTEAHAQQPFGPPPPGQFGQPQPQPGQFGQPQPGQFGQPQPGQFGQPPPGQFGQPQQNPFGQPQPQPGQFGAPPPASGQVSGSVGLDGASATGDATAEAPKIDEAEERARTLLEQPNTFGSTGLLRTSYAGSGAAGTFRVSFLSDFFSTSNFLCDPNLSTAAGQRITCSRDNLGDSASHVGAFFSLSATPFSFLEAFATIRTYANANDQGKPQLLQVLGDTTLGVKGFTPFRIGKYFTFGAEAQLLLMNGTGSVGVAGSGTSAMFRALASADLRKPGGQGFPLRINLNLGYKIDNSGQLVKDVEEGRAKELRNPPTSGRVPISRIERFGLGINKVDFFQPWLGVEVPLRWVQPYVEYSVDIPVNRQGYECHTGYVARGDVCLGLTDFGAADPQKAGGAGYSALPSRLSIGARVTPFSKAFRGLAGHVGADIGLSGTSMFIEEVAPQAPWTLYVGLSYAYDTKEVPPPPPEKIMLPAPPAEKIVLPAPQTFVRGTVHETNKPDAPIVDAIVSLDGSQDPPFATGAGGKFLTRHLEPGTYTFSIKAPGYKPNTCQANVVAAVPPPPPPPEQLQPGRVGVPGQFGAQPGAFGQPAPGAFGQPGVFGQPGMAPPGQPGAFGQPGAAPPGQQAPQPALPEAPKGPTYVDIDCSLEALPKIGAVSAVVRDAETGEAVGGAVVHLVDATGKERVMTADGNGAVSFRDLPLGPVKLRAEASGFMNHLGESDVRLNDEAKVTLGMNKRPEKGQVKVQGNEIKVSRQVHFETDSAKILGDSNTLLEEIADVLARNPKIRKVEIQGHTDNTGTRERNQTLSEQRAQAVRAWLVSAGVEAGRLVAKGYGQDKPLGPNVTSAQKAKNRRVQFIIIEKDK